jgi:glycosyltransferase involved in cell wall biosynthesis
MKILVLSSQAKNTGSNLRAYYIYTHLKAVEPATDYIEPPFNSMPLMFDFLLSLFYYFFVLMNRKYDYVIIVKPYPNTVLPALMIKAGGAKLIIDIDDLDNGYRGGILSGIIGKMQSWLVRYADSLTSHNSELIKLIIKEHPEYGGRIYMLKQSVDMDLFKITAAGRKMAAVVRKTYKGRTLLYYMAHLNIACYLEDIFTAVSLIKDENTVLIVAGGGPMFGHYRRMASDMGLGKRVIFTGQVRQEQAAAYAYASDVCLVYYKDIPVNRYRASMKLREYLALGKKTAATLVGEIRIFRGYIYGSRPDPADFARAIGKAIKSLDKKGEKGYKFIKAGFNWSTEIKQFHKYLLGGLKNG